MNNGSNEGYAAKQIYSKCGLLRWSHQSRFNRGLSLVEGLKAKSLVDYGCGDGTFLFFLKDTLDIKVGIEIDTKQIAKLKLKCNGDGRFKFYTAEENVDQKFDIVTCFEVLEHCTDDTIENVLVRLNLLCNDDGHVIISVPIETGLTMVGKQLVRRLLGMFNYGTYEYSEFYKLDEIFKMLFATATTQIHREFHEVEFQNKKYRTCGHKGFNWKRLKTMLDRHYILESVSFSPNPLPFGLLSSQVWFKCKKRT